MARTSRAEKARTRQRLVTAASREFRANGVAGTSVPRVMERVGLTQGTFYAHFASKDALMAEAVGAGLAEVVDGLLGAPAGAAPTRELPEVIERYLNAEHRDNLEDGCVLPSLAGEIRREPDPVRQAFTEELESFFARLAPLLPDDAPDARTDHGMVLVAGMAGAILLARAVNDPALSDHILRACRDYYTGAFAPRSETESPSAGEEVAVRG
jgi:TetR/AcrR family transcriptional repressor of nem operon